MMRVYSCREDVQEQIESEARLLEAVDDVYQVEPDVWVVAITRLLEEVVDASPETYAFLMRKLAATAVVAATAAEYQRDRGLPS